VDEKDALARIGRNLVNFQTLEHLLKELIPTLSMSGTVSQVQTALKDSKRRIRKSSLGDLSNSFHSSVFGPPVEHEAPDDLTEPHFTFSLRVEAAPDRISNARKRWRRLVVERNRLVHTQLMEYDLSKPDDRTRLCSMLDEQNARVREVLDELTLLRAHKASAAAAMVEQFQDGKFFDHGSPDDA
jgi:hypothetical protein